MTLLNWDLSDDEAKAATEEKVKVKSAKKTSKKLKAPAVEDQKDTDSKTSPKKRNKSISKSETTAAVSEPEAAETKTKRKKKRSSVSETDKTDTPDKGAKKGKFWITAEGASAVAAESDDKPADQGVADGEVTSAGVSQADQAEADELKKKEKKMAVGKKKSLKFKERKRKKKINELKSKMPKAMLEEYLKPKVAEESAHQAALNYLKLWKSTRTAWKFSKVRQTWLLQNMYKADVIADSDFEVLLEYLEPLTGNAKTQTLKQATELLEEHKDSTEEDSVLITSRATQLLQAL